MKRWLTISSGSHKSAEMTRYKSFHTFLPNSSKDSLTYLYLILSGQAGRIAVCSSFIGHVSIIGGIVSLLKRKHT